MDTSPKNTIFVIVGNKSDLIEKEQVDETTAREFAKSNNAFFTLTSVKNTSGIESLFLEIAKKYTLTDSASTVENKDENQYYKKIRKESVRITKESLNKNKIKRCCY